jgi:excisionase family DNA binding protein
VAKEAEMTTNKDHDSWPDFLTVEQAAAILRIGRTLAYELARRYLASGGTEGFPVIRVGHQLRVPRARLEQWLGAPLTPPSASRLASSVSPARRRKPRRVVQSSLPFGS